MRSTEHAGGDLLTLKEAAAAYGTNAPGISRLVRRLGVALYPNPRDRRSKLVKQSDLDQALRPAPTRRDDLPPAGSPEWCRGMQEALEASNRVREKIRKDWERRGIKPIPSELALAFVRGEIELDDLP